MAKVNQVKLRQDADAAERANRFDKAIEALKQIVQENPRDWNTINRIGDLYGKLNDAKAANQEYIKVANYFSDDGFFLKSIAVWKKVLRNEPGHLDGHKSLGKLYAKQGLVAEAKQTFGFVYDEYVKRNKLREAGDVLRSMADVDPGDMKVRIRLAELYGREGDAEKAAGEYVAIAEELVKKGLLAEALQLLEKALRGGVRNARLVSAAARVYLVQKDFARAAALLEEARRAAPGEREVVLRLAEAYLGAKRPHDARSVLGELLARDPADVEVRQQLGQVCLAEGRHDEAFEQLQPAVDKLVERRQIDRAASLLQSIVQRNPSHIRSLAKLVELYRQSRNDALVAQTYSQMVEAYMAGGELVQAASCLELLVQLEPTNEQHRSKLRWLREQQAAPGERFDEDFLPAPPPVPSPPPPARREKPSLELSGPLTAEDQEFIGEHLAEGRVFRKYGLGDKARDQFESVLTRFPDNVEALQELVDLHREKGEAAAAAQRLRVLAEVLRLKGDAPRAQRYDQEADALVEPAEAPEPLAAAPPVAPPAPPVAPPVAPPPGRPHDALGDLGVEIDIDLHDGDDEPSGREEALPMPPPAEPATPPEPAFALPPPEHQLEFDPGAVSSALGEPGSSPFGADELEPPGEIGGHFLDDEPDGATGFDLGDATLGDADLPGASLEPDGPLALDDLAPSTAQRQPAIALPPPSAPVTSGLVAQPAPVTGRGLDVPPELQRALAEIEQYVSMGFVEDARGVIEEVGSRFAGHPALVQRLADLGLEMPGLDPEPGPAAEMEDLVVAEPAPRPPAPGTTAAPGEEPLQFGADFLEFTPTGEPPSVAAPGPSAPPDEPEPLAAPGDAGGFDLASELGDLFGAQPAVASEAGAGPGTDFGDASLADIFREFQKGVDKQLGKEDYETRYNLGIAYKEMGLVDEAIAEFQLAAKDESRLLECASMLGICFLEKGMPKLAVKWFEKGLVAPGRSEEEYQGLKYDLASALEQAGEPDRALALFTELYGQDTQFRDVADKMRLLGAGR